MTSKNLAEGKLRLKLIKEHGINFRPDVEPSKWPPNHEKHFRNICTLGTTNFDAWVAAMRNDWKKHPWKIGMRERAEAVTHNARECRDQGENERTWRSLIEPDVFARFSKDVLCRRCQGRLWRADIDPRTASDETFLIQYSKKPRVVGRRCQCELNGPDAQVPGKIKLFAIKEDARVMYNTTEQSRLHRKWEAPDKMIGLRVIGTLKEYLQATNRKGECPAQTLEDSLEASLFPHDMNSAVFPFIIGESKSESSSASITRIDSQIALVVEKSLRIQNELREMTEPDSAWIAGPLVWCLSHRGPCWRVAAGYMKSQQRSKIEISTLWQGLITDKSGALQLLLIMDYIYDWARYIHREAIVRQLQSLALISVDELSDTLSTTQLTVATYRQRGDILPTTEMTVASYRRKRRELKVASLTGSSGRPRNVKMRLPLMAQEREDRLASWQVSTPSLYSIDEVDREELHGSNRALPPGASNNERNLMRFRSKSIIKKEAPKNGDESNEDESGTDIGSDNHSDSDYSEDEEEGDEDEDEEEGEEGEDDEEYEDDEESEEDEEYEDEYTEDDYNSADNE